MAFAGMISPRRPSNAVFRRQSTEMRNGIDCRLDSFPWKVLDREHLRAYQYGLRKGLVGNLVIFPGSTSRGVNFCDIGGKSILPRENPRSSGAR